jgi:hypothetical protein
MKSAMGQRLLEMMEWHPSGPVEPGHPNLLVIRRLTVFWGDLVDRASIFSSAGLLPQLGIGNSVQWQYRRTTRCGRRAATMLPRCPYDHATKAGWFRQCLLASLARSFGASVPQGGNAPAPP